MCYDIKETKSVLNGEINATDEELVIFWGFCFNLSELS